MLKKHKITEVVKNNLFILIAYFKYFFKIAGNVNPPKNYKLIYEDNFDKLDKNIWILGQPWGEFHKDYLNQYYDTTGKLTYVKDNKLFLEIKKLPKHYIKKDLPDWMQYDNLPDEFTIPICTGLITTIPNWQYGWFECQIKLPIGKNYWNAFWMGGAYKWPPEIDIFEGFSNDGEYNRIKFPKLKNVKIQPNLHYGNVNQNTKNDYGAYDVPVFDATKRFVQYVCHWEKDFIKIYYDGNLIFETKDKDILKWYNNETDKMYIIIGHGLRFFCDKVDESKMIVKKFKIYQKII